MKKVEASGVILWDVCAVKGKKCTAKEAPGSVTAIWAPPGRTQINVCHECLNEQVEKGSWQIEGARASR